MSVLLQTNFQMMLQLWYAVYTTLLLQCVMISMCIYLNSLTLCIIISLQVFVGENLRYEVGSLSSGRPGGSSGSTALATVIGVCVPLLLISLATIGGI